jgi:predicted transposase/invertase (TIGR01784 family)
MTKKTIDELDLIENFLFPEALGNEVLGPPMAKLILNVLLEREIEHVIVRTQKVATTGDPNHHAIRMDVYIEEQQDGENNETKSYYDVEVDNDADIEKLPKRSRYYQAIDDSRLLKSGKDYDQLKPLWIFIITPRDLFGRGRMCYTFENRCIEEPNLSLEDGARRIFLNAVGKIGGREDLSELLRYFVDSREQNALNETTKQLHQMVEQVRKDQEVGKRFMKAFERDYYMKKAGKEEEKKKSKENTLRIARRLLEKKMPIEEILDIVELDRSELEKEGLIAPTN